MLPGLQHGVLVGAAPYGLGLDEKVLPQYLRDMGYANHMVGKVCTEILLMSEFDNDHPGAVILKMIYVNVWRACSPCDVM